MKDPLRDDLFKLRSDLNVDEKTELANTLLSQLIAHFHGKAGRSKRNFEWYKYGSIVLSALTTIAAALQAAYATAFPLWILPIFSAGATVAVAFLGVSGAQRIWIDSRTTQQRLETELFCFNEQAGAYHTLSQEQAIRLFSERVITLWTDGHNKWEQHVGND